MNVSFLNYPFIVELFVAVLERTTVWASAGMEPTVEQLNDTSPSFVFRRTRYPGAPLRILKFYKINISTNQYREVNDNYLVKANTSALLTCNMLKVPNI